MWSKKGTPMIQGFSVIAICTTLLACSPSPTASAPTPHQPAAQGSPSASPADPDDWTPVEIPASLLDEIASPASTNALFEGQHARIAVWCRKADGYHCAAKAGELDRGVSERVGSALPASLFDAARGRTVEMLCELRDNWRCSARVGQAVPAQSAPTAE
jgi:hypothetical protein